MTKSVGNLLSATVFAASITCVGVEIKASPTIAAKYLDVISLILLMVFVIHTMSITADMVELSD